LRNRFGVIHKLEFYNILEISKIIKRSSEILNIIIEDKACEEIAKCSRATPRIANRLLKRVRDYAQMKNINLISKGVVGEALEMLDVDQLGLEPADRELLEVLIKKFKGGPVGIQTIAAAFSEEVQTIEEVYEPYLLQVGLIERTPRGRKATKAAFAHLGIKQDDYDQTHLL
jgi:Holliday junction DNA helicase RuvB